MKIWLSKNSEVSVGDQLVEQITLGVVSHDLEVGEKLPSTRELARRFGIHQNTVIAAYRRLAETGLVEFKKGSGVYVTAAKKVDPNSRTLASIVDRLLTEAESAGYTFTNVLKELKSRIHPAKPNRFLLVESDVELRMILLAEIESATGCQAAGVAFEEFSAPGEDDNLQVAAFTQKEAVSKMCHPARKSIFLWPNSVPTTMSANTRPSDRDLIAVVSSWGKFLNLAKLFLMAANIDPDTIITRAPDSPDWSRGLQNASLIICDTLASKYFHDDERLRVFPLISDTSLAELRSAM